MKNLFLKPIIKGIIEGLAFLIVTIILFNNFVQFLIFLNLFSVGDIQYIGSISVLLAWCNMATRTFFGFKIVEI